MASAQDIVKYVVTGISALDLFIFSSIFITYLVVIQFKSKLFWTKVGSVLILLFFVAFKATHIVAFMSTISIFKIPYSDYILIGLTALSIMLALVPLVTAAITFYHSSDAKIEEYKPKAVKIVMPVYNEKPEALWKAIESVKALDYDQDLIHMYVAFDDDTEPEAYCYLMEQMNQDRATAGKVVTVIDGLTFSICRFPHGGKKSAQQGAYNLIKNDYSEEELESSLLFFIDSDIQLKSDALRQFVCHMEKRNKNTLTGMITCMTSENPTFLAYYQDVEYVSGQLFWRNMEDYFGAMSCLPGAFTILKWTSFDGIADDYFSKTTYDDAFEYHRFYLGEDRYLTHLLMEREPWKMGFCEKARCKTEAPDTLMGLLKQRKRWFLGHISNDTWMISSLALWRRYPIHTFFNFLNNSRNTSIYIYLLYFLVFMNQDTPIILWFLYILLPIILAWLFIVYYAYTLKRKMNMLFYLIIVVMQPIFSMMFMYYTIWTIRTQSWGGARVDKKEEEEPLVIVVPEPIKE